MADSDIVIWFAEHHCFGDVLVARRHVAGWKVAEARRLDTTAPPHAGGNVRRGGGS